MSHYKAVFIDFGGVLYKSPSPRSITRLLRLFGVTDLGPMSLLNASPLESQWVADLWTGKIPEHTVWEDMGRRWRMHPRVLAFLRRSGHRPRYLDRTLAGYIAGLRPHYRTAILTNAGTDFRKTFGAAYRLDQKVDRLIISAEEGLAKPDPAIFLHAAAQMGVSAQESIFIDDRAENVEGACQAGMEAFLFESSEQTITRLKTLLPA